MCVSKKDYSYSELSALERLRYVLVDSRMCVTKFHAEKNKIAASQRKPHTQNSVSDQRYLALSFLPDESGQETYKNKQNYDRIIHVYVCEILLVAHDIFIRHFYAHKFWTNRGKWYFLPVA